LRTGPRRPSGSGGRGAGDDDEVPAAFGAAVTELGTAREVGTKFGRWLDLTMMRLAL
jgi:hypothetical protein